MSFMAAKCPSCAGDLQVPDDRDTVKCMYCGNDIVVREAIQLAGGVNVENLMLLAKAAEDSQKYDEAYKYYSKVLEYDTNNVEAWIGKGSTCASHGGGDYKLAANCFQRAISLSSDQRKIRDIIINKIKERVPTHMLALQGGYYGPVYQYLVIIHEVDPSDIVGLVAKASVEVVECSTTKSDLSKAIEYYKKAWGLSKHDGQIAKLISSNVANSYLFQSRANVADGIDKGQALIGFVHEIDPDDRPIEKQIIKKMYDHYRYRKDYEGTLGNDKQIFHDLLREIKRVDRTFNPGKIPDCFKSGCFIATAAFDSPHAPEVLLFKNYRDTYLQGTNWGKRFINLYYAVSPSIAYIIRKNNTLKATTKMLLKAMIPIIKKHSTQGRD